MGVILYFPSMETPYSHGCIFVFSIHGNTIFPWVHFAFSISGNVYFHRCSIVFPSMETSIPMGVFAFSICGTSISHGATTVFSIYGNVYSHVCIMYVPSMELPTTIHGEISSSINGNFCFYRYITIIHQCKVLQIPHMEVA